MSIKQQIEKRLGRTHKLYMDAIEHIDENILSQKLSNLASNTFGQQIWCVIGARNSFLKAIKANAWQGFECPLEWNKTGAKNSVKESLISTYKDLSDYLQQNNKLNESQIDWLLNLIEHEVQHHGQLIRYMYGLKTGVPQSWKDRYSLD